MAKRHLDLPVNLLETGLLPVMQHRVVDRFATVSTISSEHSQVDGHEDCPNCRDTKWDYT